MLVICLALILAVAATAGTTLAKYVTDASGSLTQATVANWGFTVSVDTANMFGQYYGTKQKLIAAQAQL